MADNLDERLRRWVGAAVIDADTAERIRVFEATHGDGRLRWPVLIALAFGALLLGAGVLLFVSAHWDELSPSARMLLVLLLVAVFHAGAAAVRGRFDSMSVALHALGTIALGAGLALTGQIFNLDTEWSTGALLWACGAAAGWALLREWPQSAILALLAPYWLIVEWKDHFKGHATAAAAGCAMLAFTYLSARMHARDNPVRKSLAWIGALGLFPSIVIVCITGREITGEKEWLGYAVAIVASAGLAVILRGTAAIYNAGAIAWVMVLMGIVSHTESVGAYAWLAFGAIGLTAWGIAERRAERINLGVAGFAITVLTFYFSSVMDKIGRSASLIALGILFLAGGYGLERLRRRLVAHIGEAA